MFVVYKFITRI